MTKGKPKRYSINKIDRAFRYAVCELMCGMRKDKVSKCIDEEGACMQYKTFMKKVTL